MHWPPAAAAAAAAAFEVEGTKDQWLHVALVAASHALQHADADATVDVLLTAHAKIWSVKTLTAVQPGSSGMLFTCARSAASAPG